LDDPQGLIVAGGISFVLALVTACVSGVSFVRLSIYEKMQEEGNKRATRLLHILSSHKDKVISGLSFIRLVLSLILGMYIALLCFKGRDVNLFCFYSMFAGSLLVGEIIPRYLSRLNPENSTLFLYHIILAVSWFSIPISKLFATVFKPITSRLEPERVNESWITEEEIQRIVKEGHKLGIIEEEEKEMIHSIFEFTDTIVREVMVPRVDIVAVEDTATISDAIDKMEESGFSRLPVYSKSLDNIIGILYNKDILTYVKEGRLNTSVSEVTRVPYFVPSTKHVDDLLKEMQRWHISIAIVVDEYGGTAGLVTMEDLLEVIVGEITDEYDMEVPDIEEVDKNIWRIKGSTIIEDVNNTLKTKIPVDEYETIGGFVLGYLGRIPREGENIEIKDLKINILVEKVYNQRIKSLIVKKL